MIPEGIAKRGKITVDFWKGIDLTEVRADVQMSNLSDRR